MDKENILSAKNNIQNLGGIILLSSPLSEAKSLVETTQKMEAEVTQAFEKISLLRNDASEMEKEDINVDDYRKQIDKLEKQLLKEAKTDFGKKYLDRINEKLLERMTEAVVVEEVIEAKTIVVEPVEEVAETEAVVVEAEDKK